MRRPSECGRMERPPMNMALAEPPKRRRRAPALSTTHPHPHTTTTTTTAKRQLPLPRLLKKPRTTAGPFHCYAWCQARVPPFPAADAGPIMSSACSAYYSTRRLRHGSRHRQPPSTRPTCQDLSRLLCAMSESCPRLHACAPLSTSTHAYHAHRCLPACLTACKCHCLLARA